MTRVVPKLRAVVILTLGMMAALAVRQLMAGNIPQGQTPPSQNAAVQPKFVFQVQSNIVVVDVAVTDAKGNPVHGLKAADFSLREDGQPMLLKSFEEHSVDATPTVAPPPVMPGVNQFTNATLPPENNGPLYVILFDPANITWGNQANVRGQMLQFAKKIPNGASVSVFRVTNGLKLLQGFTTDHAAIYNAIQNLTTYTGPTLYSASDHLAIFSSLSHYLGSLPGRKNLIWFSGSFPLSIPGQQSFEPQVKAMDNELIRAHIALYPIDSRGLRVRPSGADFWEHQTMKMAADATGGKAFYNTNDLVQATAEAVNDGANYYTLSYEPTNPKLDGSYRKLKVDVDQKYLQLAYRGGYYTDDEKAMQRAEEKAEQKPQKPAPYVPTTPMQMAMQFGAPVPVDILFTVNVDLSGEKDETLPTTNIANAKLMKPPYRHLTVNYTGDIRDLTDNVTADGIHHVMLEAEAVLYSADGRAINSVNNAKQLNLPDKNFQALLKTGLHLHQQIDAPAKGEYYLRVGIHDLSNNHIGAVEIPLTNIKQQTALAK